MTKKDYEFSMDDSEVQPIASVAFGDRISYIYLKYRLLEARIQKAVGMNHKATEICISIMTYVKMFHDQEKLEKEAPAKFWLTAVKAAQI